MSRLEDLQPEAVVRGILPDALVTVVHVKWVGDDALQLTYETSDGNVGTHPLSRDDESRIEVVEKERPSSAFFQGDVRKGLDAIRRKLLDLTGRNRLLNYRHSKKSSLRFVDELPDQLYELLMDGKELVIEPVRPPSRMDVWKLRGEAGTSGHDQATADRGMPSALEWANHLGIATPFELPHPSDPATPQARHQDRSIQTLHYPDELEAILSNLASMARSAIEETGSNILYLSFGFLEWSEAEESNSFLAPLFLVPVTIRRGAPDRETSTYRFYLSYSGEDVATNISLQEKQRRDFAISLPDVDADATPESYLKQLRPLLVAKPTWRLHRYATLGFLSFGKLAMYRDLDPNRWPDRDSIADNPIIRDFFLGRESTDTAAAEEYDLDRLEWAPDLIEDADSSQHSALVDALRGRNLVIQGPPGTGKSQTITNLIAAALEQGKTVLFVSEKLAALEVVRHRLERAGLGDLCLELHSHKTRKTALLDDLKKRLSKRGTFGAVRNLRELRASLGIVKQRLNRYAALMNSTTGALGMTVHEVIWRARLSKRSLGKAARGVADVTEPAAGTLEPDAYTSACAAISSFARAFSRVRSEGRELSDHPWHGLKGNTVTFLDVQRVCERVTRLCAIAEALADDPAFGSTPGAMRECVEEVNDLVDFPATGRRDWLAVAADPDVRAAVSQGFALATECEALAKELQATGCPAEGLMDPRWRDVKAAGEEIRRLAPDADDIHAAQAFARRLSEGVRLVEVAASVVSELRHACSREGDVIVGEVAPLIALIRAVTETPILALGLRDPLMLQPEYRRVLKTAMEEDRALTARRQLLSRKYDLRVTPQAPVLRRFAQVLSSAGVFGMFDREYRVARRAFSGAVSLSEEVSQARGGRRASHPR